MAGPGGLAVAAGAMRVDSRRTTSWVPPPRPTSISCNGALPAGGTDRPGGRPGRWTATGMDGRDGRRRGGAAGSGDPRRTGATQPGHEPAAAAAPPEARPAVAKSRGAYRPASRRRPSRRPSGRCGGTRCARLTALGVIIGVAAVIAVMEIGQGSKIQLQKTIARMGANNILVFPGAATSGGVVSAPAASRPSPRRIATTWWRSAPRSPRRRRGPCPRPDRLR